MRTRVSFKHFLVAVLLAQTAGGLATAADGAASAPAAGADDAALRLMPDIDSLIGDANCNRPADCHVIGVGARACGGPERYRAWSILDTNERALNTAVTRQADARRAALERLGMRSTCTVLPMPQATCRIAVDARSGRCTLLSGGALTE